MDEPKLQPPGAGLPLIPRLFVKYLGRWDLRRQYSWQTTPTILEERVANLLQMAGPELTSEQLQRRVLVPPITGLEDSSRFWSIAMVFEHLNMTGEIFYGIILQLSRGEPVTNRRGIADVKPHTQVGREQIEQFKSFHVGLGQKIVSEAGAQLEGPRFGHPWFGPMTAREWFGLLAGHLLIHAKQLEAIRKTLSL